MADEVHLSITSDADMVPARAQGRALAVSLGFSTTDATLIATAISEIVRNILVHVGRGELVIRPVVVARDDGPGIRDIATALEHGHASRGGLGLGLPGARRLMDEFHIASEPHNGTTVTMTKWRIRDELERLREQRRERG